MPQVLAISGSLRNASRNTQLVQAAIQVAPPGIEITVYQGLETLPYFNPDLAEPPSVAQLKALIAAADGLLICSPEYAHGLPGVLKNALDWLVSGTEVVGKPVALLNAAPRATHAQASLKEILTTMAARVVEEASLAVPIAGLRLTAAEIAAHPTLAPLLRQAISALLA